MSSEGKASLVPKLRFPEFRNAGKWEKEYLRDYLTESRVSGSTGDLAKKLTVKLWGGGVFARDQAIQGSINTRYYRRSAGQFIYSKLDFLNQAFGLIPEHLDGYESPVDLPCFDLSGGLDPAFLLAYVQRQEFYKKVGESADGSRIARRIDPETILNFPVRIPQSREQQKIANCLTSLDELIAAQTRKVNALKTQKVGLMQLLFPREGKALPRLRFPNFRDPSAWKKKVLGELADIKSGSTPSRANAEFFVGGSIPWVKTTDLNNSLISKTEEKITTKARARINPVGSVLVAMYGGFSQIGRTGCLAVRAATNQAISVLVLDQEVAWPAYVVAWLNAKVEDWKRIASSSRKDPNITGADVAKFPIALPGIKEQKRICDALASLDNIIDAATQELAALKTHKKALLQQLFPGADALEA